MVQGEDIDWGLKPKGETREEKGVNKYSSREEIGAERMRGLDWGEIASFPLRNISIRTASRPDESSFRIHCVRLTSDTFV